MSEVKEEYLFQRRSFVSHKQSGTELLHVNDGGVLISASSNETKPQAGQSGLIDLCVANRIGYRGVNAQAHLTANGYPIPEAPNHCELSDNGELVLRLGETEFWLLANSANLSQAFNNPDISVDKCYPLFCQDSHSWLMMVGPSLPEIMAKICGVDLSITQFPVGEIRQTSVAKINAVIVHHNVDEQSVFSIFSDSASAQYLWDVLLDTMKEYNGTPMGLNAIM